jgi:hypothetical protein
VSFGTRCVSFGFGPRSVSVRFGARRARFGGPGRVLRQHHVAKELWEKSAWGLTLRAASASLRSVPITELRIEGLRTIEKVRLRLDGLTVLIGDNGTGKSSILEACEILRRATGRRFMRAEGGTAPVEPPSRRPRLTFTYLMPG